MSATTNEPPAQAPAKTSGLAIASLVCGIVGPCTLGLASIAGLILGIVGLKKIKAGGGAVGGRGLAIAGIIVSVATLIIGLILAVFFAGVWFFAGHRIEGRTEQARISAARAEIANLRFALDLFELDLGRYPSTEEGLKVLIDPPQDPTRWRGPYLKRSPKDAWGNSYMYRFPGRHNTNGYDLYSFGPDGQEGGGDDIDNWSRR